MNFRLLLTTLARTQLVWQCARLHHVSRPIGSIPRLSKTKETSFRSSLLTLMPARILPMPGPCLRLTCNAVPRGPVTATCWPVSCGEGCAKLKKQYKSNDRAFSQQGGHTGTSVRSSMEGLEPGRCQHESTRGLVLASDSLTLQCQELPLCRHMLAVPCLSKGRV
jgi:hypothetical protein